MPFSLCGVPFSFELCSAEIGLLEYSELCSDLLKDFVSVLKLNGTFQAFIKHLYNGDT